MPFSGFFLFFLVAIVSILTCTTGAEGSQFLSKLIALAKNFCGSSLSDEEPPMKK